MQSRSPSLLTRVGGWVAGRLESNAQLNSKLRIKLKLKFELSLAKILVERESLKVRRFDVISEVPWSVLGP